MSGPFAAADVASSLRNDFSTLVDVWPPELWPWLQIPFYVLAVLWFLVSILSLMGLLLMRLGILPPLGTH